MKKILFLFSLTALFGLILPAEAVSPPPHGAGNVIHAGPGRHWKPAPPPPQRYYTRGMFIRPCYDCRLGWYDGYYYRRPCYDGGIYINLGIPVRF